MEKIVILMLIFLASISTEVRAQQFTTVEDDSLRYFLEKYNLDAFLIKMNLFSTLNYTSADSNALSRLAYYLKKDLGRPLYSAQRYLLRKTAMRFGYSIVKSSGNINEGLLIYLIAHNNVE